MSILLMLDPLSPEFLLGEFLPELFFPFPSLCLLLRGIYATLHYCCQNESKFVLFLPVVHEYIDSYCVKFFISLFNLFIKSLI